uniref:Uncharacterized protein n=1 Tax=Anopheles coluzzii TaxID=1518534 RepID=A0A8W7PFM9_ANOCL
MNKCTVGRLLICLLIAFIAGAHGASNYLYESEERYPVPASNLLEVSTIKCLQSLHDPINVTALQSTLQAHVLCLVCDNFLATDFTPELDHGDTLPHSCLWCDRNRTIWCEEEL